MIQHAEPGTAEERLRPTAALHLHEWLSIAFVTVGVFLLERLPVTYPRSALFLAYASPVALISLLAAGVIALRRSRGNVSITSWQDELAVLARCVAPVFFVFPVAFLLKSFIYLINSRVWDRELLELDAALHFGFSPTLFLTTLFGEPFLLRIIDIFYTRFYYLMFIGYTAVLLARLPPERKVQFAGAFVLLWIYGSVIYLLLPSWGPAFYATELVRDALEHMPRTVAVQTVLYEELSSLVHRPLEPRVVRFGCVAAFPSLHVGVTTLFAIASRHLSQRWFRFNLLLIVFMVIGSIVTGYHYAVDAYAGGLLALLAWFVAKRSLAESAAQNV